MASKLQWISSFIKEYSLSDSELLETCTANLKAQMETSGLTVPHLPPVVNDELIKDMAKVQLQPEIMGHHRRFVIIRAASEASIPADKDGVSEFLIVRFVGCHDPNILPSSNGAHSPRLTSRTSSSND